MTASLQRILVLLMHSLLATSSRQLSHASQVLSRRTRMFMSTTSTTSSPTSESTQHLLAVHVKASLKPGVETEFFNLAQRTSMQLLRHEGVLRYDILRNNDDASKYLLIKVFDDVKSLDSHKLTKYYTSYTEEASQFITQARDTSRFSVLFPTDASNWDCSSAGASVTDLTSQQSTENGSVGDIISVSKAGKQGCLAVVVEVRVRPESIDEFILATLANCRASLLEPGVTRFDLLRSLKDPCFFSLVEIYNTLTAPAAHKATPHYATWAAAVAPMMAAPRSATKYTTLFPSPLHYHLTSTYSHPASKQGSLAAFSFIAPKLLMGRGTYSLLCYVMDYTCVLLSIIG